MSNFGITETTSLVVLTLKDWSHVFPRRFLSPETFTKRYNLDNIFSTFRLLLGIVWPINFLFLLINLLIKNWRLQLCCMLSRNQPTGLRFHNQTCPYLFSVAIVSTREITTILSKQVNLFIDVPSVLHFW